MQVRACPFCGQGTRQWPELHRLPENSKELLSFPKCRLPDESHYTWSTSISEFGWSRGVSLLAHGLGIYVSKMLQISKPTPFSVITVWLDSLRRKYEACKLRNWILVPGQTGVMVNWLKSSFGSGHWSLARWIRSHPFKNQLDFPSVLQVVKSIIHVISSMCFISREIWTKTWQVSHTIATSRSNMYFYHSFCMPSFPGAKAQLHRRPRWSHTAKRRSTGGDKNDQSKKEVVFYVKEIHPTSAKSHVFFQMSIIPHSDTMHMHHMFNKRQGSKVSCLKFNPNVCSSCRDRIFSRPTCGTPKPIASMTSLKQLSFQVLCPLKTSPIFGWWKKGMEKMR